jgi:hypothetical protein
MASALTAPEGRGSEPIEFAIVRFRDHRGWSVPELPRRFGSDREGPLALWGRPNSRPHVSGRGFSVAPRDMRLSTNREVPLPTLSRA